MVDGQRLAEHFGAVPLGYVEIGITQIGVLYGSRTRLAGRGHFRMEVTHRRNVAKGGLGWNSRRHGALFVNLSASWCSPRPPEDFVG
jgi:hypothetical protein